MGNSQHRVVCTDCDNYKKCEHFNYKNFSCGYCGYKFNFDTEITYYNRYLPYSCNCDKNKNRIFYLTTLKNKEDIANATCRACYNKHEYNITDKIIKCDKCDGMGGLKKPCSNSFCLCYDCQYKNGFIKICYKCKGNGGIETTKLVKCSFCKTRDSVKSKLHGPINETTWPVYRKEH